jgi:3-oxoacyl-[acyl-carrier protein] reductase
MDLGLKDKRALVTGSSRGLGFATAQLLAEEGAAVAINGRNEERLAAAAQRIEQSSSKKVIYLPGDIADPKVPGQLVSSAADLLGGLDLLITNAGGPPSGAFESFSDEAWLNAINLTLMSHVRLIRAALSYLRQSSQGSVLTITSYAVKQPIPNLVLSNSIRSAVTGLTKTLALELGHLGIRFNSILPAWTETERIQELMAFRAGQNNTTLQEELIKQAKESALGRIGTPREFANAAVFLVSPAASYITGVMLTVDGGLYKGTL